MPERAIVNLEPPATLLEYLKRATEFFAARKIDNPRLNAERLLCGVLKCRRIDLYVRFDQALAQGEIDAYREFVRRRVREEPIQYILGTTEFYGREFIVTPDVLIPRPETEGLVEKLLERLARSDAPIVADIGTGSGCIALTVAAEIPNACVFASDISEPALAVAADNAARLGIMDRVTFARGDLLAPFEGTRFDAIVENLPYIGLDEKGSLPANVVDYEPHVALFSEKHGLALIERLVSRVSEHLLPGGIVALEIASGQAREVEKLFMEAHPSCRVECQSDLGGLDRYVFASELTSHV